MSHRGIGIFARYCKCCRTNHCQQSKTLVANRRRRSNHRRRVGPDFCLFRHREETTSDPDSPRQTSSPDVVGKSEGPTRSGLAPF